MSASSTLTAKDVKNNQVLVGRGAKCTVVRKNGCGRRRILCKMSNAGGITDFKVFNSDIKTSMKGLLERLFFVKKSGQFVTTHWPSTQYVTDELKEFSDAIVKFVGRRYPASKQAIVSMYTGAKRTIYENASKSLDLKPVCRRDSYLQTFIKVEKTDFTAKKEPSPRVIQPRNPRYHLQVARYLKPIEKHVYLAINFVFGYNVVAKGMNAIERGRLIQEAWDDFADPVAIAADAKRFDQHVSLPMLSWEHEIYNQIFKDKKLRMLLNWQKHNKGFVNCEDGTAYYEINGCRMSGDINTALGNVIIMCAMFHHFLKDKPKARYINDGDDCILIVEKSHLHQFDDLVEKFAKFGFTMELDEPVTMIERIDFCQCRPVYFPDGYRMIRNLQPCLTKDLHTTKSIRTESDLRTQLKSISQCGLSIASDCPIYGSFYTNMFRINDSGKIDKNPEKDGKFWLSQRMPKLGTEIDYRTRASFCIAFGISPVEQRLLETKVGNFQYPFTKVEPHSNLGLL